MDQQLLTEQKIINEVKKAVAETLSIEEGTINPESSLIKDLGAESLDFLDINYRLEQAFGIKMARHFIIEHIEEMFGEGSAIDENGKLTEKAIDLLKTRFAEHAADFRTDMDMDEVPTLITIRSMARGVMDILNSLSEQCPSCKKSAWKSDDGSHIVCGACGEPAAFTNGDDLIRQWLTKAQEEKKIF